MYYIYSCIQFRTYPSITSLSQYEPFHLNLLRNFELNLRSENLILQIYAA